VTYERASHHERAFSSAVAASTYGGPSSPPHLGGFGRKRRRVRDACCPVVVHNDPPAEAAPSRWLHLAIAVAASVTVSAPGSAAGSKPRRPGHASQEPAPEKKSGGQRPLDALASKVEVTMSRHRWAVGLALLFLGGGLALHEGPARAERVKKPAPPPPPRKSAPSRAAAGMPYGQMVSIAAGKFTMGSNSGDTDEAPPHEVDVPGFSMDRTEVTVNAYKECVDAGKCSEPDSDGPCNWKKGGREGHPINCVVWNQATAFCSWAGKRLPTEAEWEYAARGAAGREFPWGSSAPRNQLCWDGEGNGVGKGNRMSTCPSGSFPAGATPETLQDMAGNVWEWVEDQHCPYKEGDKTSVSKKCTNRVHVFRGGSWNDSDPSHVRGASRNGGSTSNDVGFRCARALLLVRRAPARGRCGDGRGERRGHAVPRSPPSRPPSFVPSHDALCPQLLALADLCRAANALVLAEQSHVYGVARAFPEESPLAHLITDIEPLERRSANAKALNKCTGSPNASFSASNGCGGSGHGDVEPPDRPVGAGAAAVFADEGGGQALRLPSRRPPRAVRRGDAAAARGHP
jgi:formylglycine-generating enzyme required for sulfatase activity